MNNHLSVREIVESDIELIINYWQNANDEFLVGMGVDLNKLPSSEEWKIMLQHVVNDPIEIKKSFCTIWLENNIPIGHCNVNKIIFGKEAFMHLHLWNSTSRKKGLGVELVKKSIRLFFQKLQLKELFCEPYSLNPAPNKTLEKIGFTFLKTYITIPGSLNFEQRVNLWQLKKEKLTDL
jgi:ribosomal-protein-alanine N-acetyltransferase